jgi:glycerol-3-phosphate acyltransferase PlsY
MIAHGASEGEMRALELLLIAMTVLYAAPGVISSYLLGSIPFGYLIGRIRGVDIRKSGSGNIGATNVGRVLGKKWGYACFLLDVAKGMAPVLVWGSMCRHGGILSHSFVGADEGATVFQVVWLLVACAAIMGHVFNIWLGFKGGKGVATALGVVLGVFPYFTYAGLAAFGIWIVVTLATRYVSVGSIVAAAAFVPLFAVFNMGHVRELAPLGIFAGAMACLIIIKHRGNIKRLLNGTENKIGEKNN